VFQKPVDELEEVLGIDVPPVPDISLSSITSNTVLLYWKPSENYHSPLRQCIQINGVNSKFMSYVRQLGLTMSTVEEFDHSDDSIQLTGLQPGFYYGIRAIATNSAGNSTYSKLIQVQTVPKDGNRGVKLLADAEQNHVKRTVSGRRVSQPTSNVNQLPVPSIPDPAAKEGPDSEETINLLTRQLDTLRHQQESSENELVKEIEEFEQQRAKQTLDRDNMKKEVDEKEKTSQELRKQVNELEKQSKATQRKRQGKEKTLQQKRAERQKMRDDIKRWTEESSAMQEKIGAFETQKLGAEDVHTVKIEQTRQAIDATVSENKMLEEEIRVLGIAIKDLEEERKIAHRAQNEEEEEAERRERAEEQDHEEKIRRMQDQYTILWTENSKAEAHLQASQELLATLLDIQSRDPSMFAPIPSTDYSGILANSRRHRGGGGGGSRIGSQTFPSNLLYSGSSPYNNVSALFPSNSSFANNRIIPLGPGLRSQSIEMLTAGAPMSPSANQLLPSDLLGDDDYPNIPFNRPEQPKIDTSNRRSSSWDWNGQETQSPRSANSQSPSLLSSPHESFSNIPTLFSGMDADRHSLNSTGSPYHQALHVTSDNQTTRRRSNLFNFARQRPKSSVNELPQLGSLKPSQSQSFPLNEPEPPSTGLRKLGSSVWSSPMANLLNRGSTTAMEDGTGPSTLPRKTRRGLFGSKLDPSEPFGSLDRSASPRPPSTNSYEHGLPRPSSDNHPFGWEGMRQRTSPLGGDWVNPVGTPWSRNQSRRQSIQHGSTSNLSLGSTPLDPEDLAAPYHKTIPPAPIGTERFNINKGKTKNPPKLNPAAPSFTARLFKKEKTPKIDKSEFESQETSATTSKSKNKRKEKGLKHAKSRESDGGLLSEDSTSYSYSSPRLSRDTYSMDDESQASIEHTTSTTTHSSDAGITPSSLTPKESLMQRITRKSSSSKFSAAWKERGGLFSSKKSAGEPGTPGEQDEDAISDYMGGRSVDTAVSSTTGSGPVGLGVGGTGIGEKDKDRERSGRLSSSWGRVMNMKGKSKGKEKEERESLEGDRVEQDDE
jgi:hypothetical protein